MYYLVMHKAMTWSRIFVSCSNLSEAMPHYHTTFYTMLLTVALLSNMNYIVQYFHFIPHDRTAAQLS